MKSDIRDTTTKSEHTTVKSDTNTESEISEKPIKSQTQSEDTVREPPVKKIKHNKSINTQETESKSQILQKEGKKSKQIKQTLPSSKTHNNEKSSFDASLLFGKSSGNQKKKTINSNEKKKSNSSKDISNSRLWAFGINPSKFRYHQKQSGLNSNKNENNKIKSSNNKKPFKFNKSKPNNVKNNNKQKFKAQKQSKKE